MFVLPALANTQHLGEQMSVILDLDEPISLRQMTHSIYMRNFYILVVKKEPFSSSYRTIFLLALFYGVGATSHKTEACVQK